MATAEKKKKKNKVKEGHNLLGSPTFEELENGRFKCLETGHELAAKDKESYSQSKRCRLGLIDAALSQKKPPLNMFKQDPLCRSKLICKLTGDTVNKSEEHIWKHINGKRFLHKLEQKEAENPTSNGMAVEDAKQLPRKLSKPSASGLKKDRKKGVQKDDSQEIRPIDDGNLVEPDFWTPPVGSRWDFDDGGDRWGSGTDSEQESDGGDIVDEDGGIKAEELSTRTKRMSIEVGPSSFASRKKKSKTISTQEKCP
ncbi:PREDICTED: uncharacterized protein LOC104593059 isoform X2 [Nelumbo nucifera]|uniref:Uncharacterized protein LOC104593059 isoform X2 n=1 Tax=Nelumbo nucifera TaxID=4432 RepID=A0A1U7ZS09_NELNU|nr:PREDICTED: uncharacterized protein LOC104593059 isoform X2 [Nelumbo nucifera]